MSRSWAVLGPGRCGLQLARSMRAAGIHLSGVVARTPADGQRARAMLPGVTVLGPTDALPVESALLITVPDCEIAPLAEALADRHARLPSFALHTSGALPSGELTALHGKGVHIGSFHPLVSFASADGPLVTLRGATACVEGRPGAVAAGIELARALEMRPHHIVASAKPLYHAAATLAGNLTHVVVRLALEQLTAAGFSPRSAAAALSPLIEVAVHNALESDDWSRLTGVLVRGDSATVTAHLKALPEDVATVYRAVSMLAIERLGTAENIDRNSLEALRTALTTDTLCASVPLMCRQEGN